MHTQIISGPQARVHGDGLLSWNEVNLQQMAVISVCGGGRGRRLTGTVIRARPQLCLECFHSSKELSKTPPPPGRKVTFVYVKLPGSRRKQSFLIRPSSSKISKARRRRRSEHNLGDKSIQVVPSLLKLSVFSRV